MLGTAIIRAARENNGLPEGDTYLKVKTEPLSVMADKIYTRTATEITSVKPAGILELSDASRYV